jgi:Flp pilus assembly protein TadG
VNCTRARKRSARFPLLSLIKLSFLTRRVDPRSERGQTLVLVALLMPVLLGMVGVVLDVGHAYSVQRKLQASADSAALAGAASLPSTANAISTATSYGAKPGEKNALGGSDTVTENVATTCLVTFHGCPTANAVTVTESATVNTLFARVLGVKTFTVNAKSTACSPCGSKPLDVMIVLDRTGSMCRDDNNRPNGCLDLTNARNGITAFLQLMDPSIDHVGLAVLPPAPSSTKPCGSPAITYRNGGSYPTGGTYDDYYADPTAPYVLVPLSNSYASRTGVLNTTSPLVSTLNCVPADGWTAYAQALEAAQAELVKDGRAGVQKVIVFFSDGAANTGPRYLDSSSKCASSNTCTTPYLMQPCHQGVTSAAAIKATGTLIYSMGYDLTATGANICQTNAYVSDGHGGFTSTQKTEASITAETALQQIASGTGAPYFTQQPTAAQVTDLFQQLGANMLAGTANLVSNNTP